MNQSAGGDHPRRHQLTKELPMNTVIDDSNKTQDMHRTNPATVVPRVNIIETKDGYTLEAEMPGVGKDSVEITVEDNQLTLLGRRQPDDLKAELLHRESDNADYRRVFELDPAIDTAKISAHVEEGILTVQLPFSERVKPRKISISE
jgi:HSP20 family protein